MSPSGTISTFQYPGAVDESSVGVLVVPLSGDVSYQRENSSLALAQQILNACDKDSSVGDCMTSIGMELVDGASAAQAGQE